MSLGNLFKKGKEEKAILIIQGMTCEHCRMTVQKELEGMEGVIKAKVDLKAGKAEVQFNPDLTSQEKMRQKITDLGYKALGGEEN